MSITAQELRFNNYVLDETGAIQRIKEVSRRRVVYENKKYAYVANVSGINLTTDIVDKCDPVIGFNIWRFRTKSLTVTLEFDVDGIYWHCGPYKRYIQYLHQLQNLFFELTGEELNFQP